MARVAIISDSHGNIENLALFSNRLGPVDSLFHLGDVIEDASQIAQKLNCGYVCVRGNCDYRLDVPLERIVTWYSHRILLVHGHQYSSPLSILYKAKAECCTAVCFGHTHVPFLETMDGILMLNSGSLSRPRSQAGPSCAVLTVTEQAITAELLYRPRN